MDARRRRSRRRTLLGGALALLTGPPTALIAVAVVVAGAGTCSTAGSGSGFADAASRAAQAEIPAQWLQIFQQVGSQYRIPWEILAGIAKQECDLARDPDRSCTPQPGATGPGTANYAGASGPMQIGVGGAAGDEYQTLRRYLPDPQIGPHDPTTAVQLAALVLIKDKNAPRGAPIDTYLPYVIAYNGSGPQAQAYGQQVLADARSYQGTGTTALVSTGCAARAAATGYVNPFADASHLIPERIDMGVDYSGSGPIDAIGNARITFAATGIGGNWVCSTPANGGIVYQLTDGQHRGNYIYVAEDIIPTVHQGQHVSAGRQIATFTSPQGCIEIGFAAGPTPAPMAAALGQQAQAGDAGDNRTYCGQAMSDLIQQVGGRPGLTEGKPIVGVRC